MLGLVIEVPPAWLPISRDGVLAKVFNCGLTRCILAGHKVAEIIAEALHMTATSLTLEKSADMAQRRIEAHRTIAQPLGSSWRYRRLVLGGNVMLDPVSLAKPAMRPRELALLTSLLRQSDRVLEFGAGGSTALAIKMGVGRVTSVESDADWIDRLNRDDALGRAVEQGRLELLHADVGPVGALGRPSMKQASWPNYARRPWSHVGDRKLDLVFIDGRFRVACILETALRVSPATIIAVHDFWNRPSYHSVLPFLDQIDACESLGLFRVKGNLDVEAAERLLVTAHYDPA